MVDRIRYRWTGAGSAELDERLIIHLGRSGMLLLPARVEIEYGDSPSIRYAVPDWLDVPIPSGIDMWMFLDEGWDMLSLAEADTSMLLTDFLKLVDAKPEEVKRFVESWGPLWVCEKHGRKTGECWAPSFIFDKRFGRDCAWSPVERIDDFRIAAREARAVLNIATSLKQDEIGDMADWAAVGAKTLDLGEDRKPHDMLDTVDFHKWSLTDLVCERLSFYGPSLSLAWATNDNKPTLSVNTGFGFLRLVWLQIAQCLASTRDIYTCDGCGTVYLRDSGRRRPKEGCRNYCTDCAETARKRDWARRKKQAEQ